MADANRGKGAPTWAEDVKLNRRILIEGGEFLMGSPEDVGHHHEHPQHSVLLSPFYLQKHPVTNEEYRRFYPDHRFQRNEERHPAVGVTWGDAAEYAEWLGGRLPTEAEWEYACRAGTQTVYCCGDSTKELAKVAWYQANPRGHIHAVAKKTANRWGVHDMHGNVFEWVADWWARYEAGQRSNPVGPISSPVERRVVRGGKYDSTAEFLRSAIRGRVEPNHRRSDVGFRVAFDAAPSDD